MISKQFLLMGKLPSPDTDRAVLRWWFPGNECFTLWQSPRSIESLRISKVVRSLSSCHPNRFFTKISTHFETNTVLSAETVPSMRFSASAMLAARSLVDFVAATKASKKCLKARTTISCIHRDRTCGNFAASSACHTTTKLSPNHLSAFNPEHNWNARKITSFREVLEHRTKRRYLLTTRPKDLICRPRVCIKSVKVRPSTGDNSKDAKSATCNQNPDISIEKNRCRNQAPRKLSTGPTQSNSAESVITFLWLNRIAAFKLDFTI